MKFNGSVTLVCGIGILCQFLVIVFNLKLDVFHVLQPSPSIFITDHSKAILLLWFHLFYVLESNFCAV